MKLEELSSLSLQLYSIFKRLSYPQTRRFSSPSLFMGDDGRSGQIGGGESFYSSGWDPLVSLSQSENFGTASMVAPHGMFSGPSYPIASESTSHLLRYSSDPNALEMAPRLGGANFSDMVSPFAMPVYGQNYTAIEKAGTGLIPPLVASPNGKRKRVSDPSSPSDPNKTCEGDPDRDLSGETSEPRESNEKKPRIDQNSSPDQVMKKTGKQVRDDSKGGEGNKDNYIHVRARRGQATNSHSLAERVRREKISQRMRLLQELVPGCNKITGKAVMLDEIINYVQSLQQQVEFLSMKLATVNPELNFDIDRILSKDILHLRGGGAPVLVFNSGTSSSPHPYAPGIHQDALPGISTSSAYHRVPQSMWDGEMQGLFHMGFDANPAVANLGPNGSSKLEAP